MWPAMVIQRPGSALIETRSDLSGKNRETGRALGPKHPRRRRRRGEGWTRAETRGGHRKHPSGCVAKGCEGCMFLISVLLLQQVTITRQDMQQNTCKGREEEDC